MVEAIRFDQMISSLQATRQEYGEITWENGIRILITRYGGRIFGPFLGETGASLGWIPADWATADSASAMIAGGAWNLGGNRLWIAPEIQYNISNRADFWGTHNVPPAMDPGSYTLTLLENGWQLQQELTMQAHNLAQGEKSLKITRLVHPTPDPLRTLTRYDELLAGVRFAGYEQRVTLVDLNPNAILSEAWDLMQLNPGGQLMIPAAAGVEVAEYFGDVPEAARTVNGNHLRLNITGERQFKVGYSAAYLTGRMGYFNTLSDGTSYLLMRCFFNNPSADYSEEPPDQSGQRGYSVHVYNDGGNFGGFGEMESNGQTIGGDTGRVSSSDAFITWLYLGEREKLGAIAGILLGVTL